MPDCWRRKASRVDVACGPGRGARTALAFRRPFSRSIFLTSLMRPLPGETPRTRFGLEKAPAFGYRFGSPTSKSLFRALHDQHNTGGGRLARRSLSLLPTRPFRRGTSGERRGDYDRYPLDAGRDLPVRLPGFNRTHFAQSLSGDGNRLRALFRSHGFGGRFHCLARPAPHDLTPAHAANAAVEFSPRRDFVRHVGAEDHAVCRFFRHCVGCACSYRRAFGLHSP